MNEKKEDRKIKKKKKAWKEEGSRRSEGLAKSAKERRSKKRGERWRVENRDRRENIQCLKEGKDGHRRRGGSKTKSGGLTGPLYAREQYLLSHSLLLISRSIEHELQHAIKHAREGEGRTRSGKIADGKNRWGRRNGR